MAKWQVDTDGCVVGSDGTPVDVDGMTPLEVLWSLRESNIKQTTVRFVTGIYCRGEVNLWQKKS